MAFENAIELAKAYVPILDDVYKESSVTSDLDGNPDLVRAGANANELCIPMIDMSGLGDYSRNSGYVEGDVSLTYETVKCNFDRGRIFQTDVMDDLESAGVAFGQLAGEFIRTKVGPEVDAFRFAAYAGKDGISSKSETLETGEEVLKAIRVAVAKFDEDEVPPTQRYLYITPTLLGMIQDLDTTKSREVLANFEKIQKVPQTRFYSAIEQLSGKKVEGGADESKGGYKKAENAKNLNFMCIHKGALIQFPKHVVPKVISPENNQKADAYAFGYRNVGIADIYKNKLAGVYASISEV